VNELRLAGIEVDETVRVHWDESAAVALCVLARENAGG